MRLTLLILLLLPFSGQAQDQYTVSFDDDLDSVLVTACFEDQAPRRLYHHEEASRFTDGILVGSNTISLRSGSSSVRLPKMPSDSCVKWQVNLEQATAKQDSRFAMRVGNDVVTDGNLWFWRGSSSRKLRVEVELPGNLNISVPWQEVSRSNTSAVFVPASTGASWAYRIALGNFPTREIPLTDGNIRMAILGSPGEENEKKLESWLAQAATAVSRVHGQFPQTSPQVIVVPIGSRSNPVPWAHVMRGGGVSAEFFVDETRPLKELAEDWTACHELSHMLLPFVSRKDRWLSEGLASYYQYILLGRSGMLSEEQAWQGFYDGTRRGFNGTRRGNRSSTLAEATLQGWDYTMRVYWSGAAIMFLADTRLRAQSDNRQSLDTALAALSACCLDPGKLWRASELFTRLDRLTGTTVFTDLYDEHVNSLKFPDISPTLEELGVSFHRGRVRLIGNAEHAWVRDEIMKAPAGF